MIMKTDIVLQVLEVICKINNQEMSVSTSKEDAIEDFIDYHSDDDYETIFEEFRNHLKETRNFKETIEEYVYDTYSDRFCKVGDLYFVEYISDIDESMVEKLVEISKAKNLDQLIDFCEKYDN